MLFCYIVCFISSVIYEDYYYFLQIIIFEYDGTFVSVVHPQERETMTHPIPIPTQHEKGFDYSSSSDADDMNRTYFIVHCVQKRLLDKVNS